MRQPTRLRIFTTLSGVLLIASLLLGACAAPPVEGNAAEASTPALEPAQQETTEEPAAEPTDAPTAEPTEAPTDVGETPEEAGTEAPVETPTGAPAGVEVPEEALRANLAAFLADSDGYNATTPADIDRESSEGVAPFLLDVRAQEELEKNRRYIPGAVIVPLKLLAHNLNKLPSTDTPVVVYGATDVQAAIGAVALSALGYQDVRSMQGDSFGGWVEAGLPTANYTGG